MSEPARENKSEREEKQPAPLPASSVPPTGEPGKKLSVEEQMAAYEEHLKETDWGHQPC